MRRLIVVRIVLVLSLLGVPLLAGGDAAPAPAPKAPSLDDVEEALRDAVEEHMEDIEDWAIERYGVIPPAEPPAWADDGAMPLFSVALLADLHLGGGHGDDTRRAVALVNDLAPTFAMLLGDNVWQRDPADMPAMHRVLREQYLSALTVPVVAIRGDNDCPGYETVWGSSNWSLDLGGVRFIGFGIDHDNPYDGVGFCNRETLRWLRDAVWEHHDGPVVPVVHMPVWLPTFLDGPRLTLGFNLAGNVPVVLSGHLHRDLAFPAGRFVNLACPAVGPDASHAVRLMQVFRDHFRFITYAVDPGTEAFDGPSNWQRLDLPRRLWLDADTAPLGPLNELPVRYADPSPITIHDRLGDLLRAYLAR